MKRAATLSALLLLAPLLLLVTPSGAAATTRTLVITNSTAHPAVPFQGFDGNPPKVYDIDGDGQQEIIAQNDNQYVYIFDARTGGILFEAKTTLPPGWAARSFNGPEVSVFTQGGTVHLIVQNSAAFVTSFHLDTAASTKTHLAFVKDWERRLSDCFNNPGSDSKPVLVDLDLDGHLEIVASTEEFGIFALRDTGALFWKTCIGGGNAEPGIGDLNLDGAPDVVFGSDSGYITALNGRSGATMWGYNLLAHFNLGSGSMPVGPAIAQLDGKTGPDVVVGARDSHDANNFSNDHALLVALSAGGVLLWAKQDPTGNPLTYTHAVITDAASDGAAEVYWADWNTNGHKPPANESDAWKVLGPAHFYRYDAAGNLVWRQTLNTFWSNKDVPLADVDGDGVQEMLANGPDATGKDGIWYLDTRTGAAETFVSTWPYTVQRAPVVADFYGDGQMEWVVEVGPADPSAGGSGLLVYDTGMPYSSAWPHLPYPTVGPAPPPPSGTFNATFTIKSPNAWWQELTVQPQTTRTITAAQVRIASGAWQPMTKSSWGAWTSSYNSPAGTRVEFLATDSTNQISQSAPFTWMDGVLTKGSVQPGGPPPPTFSPTFTVPKSVNEWWVEVFVNTTEPLSGVDARVNAGSWVPLTLQSWGNWAKSFFVAQGSTVQFRATTTTGLVATSANVTWLGPPPPPPTTFNATFAPSPNNNNWWVEVKVTSASKVTAVDANVNGGPWVALTLQNWGSWAKSFNVPSGATVRFRATDDAGHTVTSGPYMWT